MKKQTNTNKIKTFLTSHWILWLSLILTGTVFTYLLTSTWDSSQNIRYSQVEKMCEFVHTVIDYRNINSDLRLEGRQILDIYKCKGDMLVAIPSRAIIIPETVLQSQPPPPLDKNGKEMIDVPVTPSSVNFVEVENNED